MAILSGGPGLDDRPDDHPTTPWRRGTTIGFSLSFLSAGRGVDLLADARVRRRAKEICNGEVIVRNAAGVDVAQAIVTYKLSS